MARPTGEFLLNTTLITACVGVLSTEADPRVKFGVLLSSGLIYILKSFIQENNIFPGKKSRDN